MRFLLVIILFISTQGHAQKVISPEVFKSKIRPQLNNILNNFYQMVALFPDFPKGLTSLIDRLEDIHNEKELLIAKCPRLLNSDCLENIDRIREKLSHLQANTLVMLTNQKMSQSLSINIAGGLRLTNAFHAELEEIKGILDNSSLMIKAETPHRRETYQVVKQIDQMATMLSLTVVEYVPYQYRSEFRHFYFGFVHPLQIQMSKIKSYDYFNRNFENLNIAFNLLNMSLTKRNKKTPDGMAPYLSVIHNRWNSLLRYYIR